MHPNPIFRKTGNQRNIEFAIERGFGTLAVSIPNESNPEQHHNAPLLSHIPFILNETGTLLEAHLVRSNPILKLLEQDQPAVVSVNGPDSYISPDWYEFDDQVPTWNYIAVHLRGNLSRLADEELPDILDRLSSKFEQMLAPKPEWLRDKMSPGVFEKMSRMIVPIKMDIEQIDGTWKLSQNKSDEVRLNAAQQVSTNGIGSEIQALSDFMKDPPA